MPQSFIPFTTLDPSAEHGGGLVRCEGVYAAHGGLRSLPKPGFQTGESGGVQAGRLNSCYVHQYPSNSGASNYVGDEATIFFGAQDALYVYAPGNPGTFTDIDGGAVFTADSAAWRFASFGNDIWAGNFNDPIRRRAANAGNFSGAAVASTFIPEARFLAPIREFLFCAALSNAGRFSDEIAWSDINDATWFDPKNATRPASLAGSKRIVSRPGQIMGLVGGEYGIIFKRNSMHAIQLTGGADIFRIDEVSDAVGTPYPSSIVCCRDGYRRFWGGDTFYRQIGLQPPEPIAGPEIAALLIDHLAHLNSVGLYRPTSLTWTSMAAEDQAMFGVEEPESGGIFWFYFGEGDNESAGANRWIYHHPASGAWTTSGNLSGVNFVCAASNRSFMSASDVLPRFLLGATYDGVAAESTFFRFQSSTHHAITLATQRFAVAQEEAPTKWQRVRVTGAQVVVTPNQATYSTDYRLAALPSGLTLRIVASNEPHFQQQLDTATTPAQVSPRSESMTVADANDHGWMTFATEGMSFLLELSLAESATALRGLRGVWLEWSAV